MWGIKLDKPLLTIAIPTYNRASCLDLCLSRIVKQTRDFGSIVEILVSNNDSTDNTDEVVSKYITSGSLIYYLKNAENIGSDRNLLQCFLKANGKYVLVMGDDDILLDGALEKVMGILREAEYGVVFMNSYGFTNDYIAEMPRVHLRGRTIYSHVDEFIRKSSYLMAFISVNIVNKECVDEAILEQLLNTHLVHLGWIFSALFNSGKNVFVNEYCIAARMYNSGGYKLCDVFAVKFNKVFDFFVSRGVNKKTFDSINHKLLSKFFPAHITRCRGSLLNLFPEDYFRTLYPLYKTYLNFWIFTVPSIFLPVPVGNFFYRAAKTVRHYTPFR